MGEYLYKPIFEFFHVDAFDLEHWILSRSNFILILKKIQIKLFTKILLCNAEIFALQKYYEYYKIFRFVKLRSMRLITFSNFHIISVFQFATLLNLIVSLTKRRSSFTTCAA